MKIPRLPMAGAAVLAALLAAASSAGAQEVERVEAKFIVTGSTVPGILEGQVIRLDAEDPSTKVAFPTFERVKLFNTTLDIQSSFYVVRGQVGSSTVEGIPIGVELDCRFNFATATCVTIEGLNDVQLQFFGTIERLHVVGQ